MKQYTNKSQTAKLIELGFEKPCSIASVEPIYGMGGISVAKAYSIGEMIEMLETRSVSINIDNLKWSVDTYYYGIDEYELIDALYAMVVKLKEVGEI
jgi:hypothetical protein